MGNYTGTQVGCLNSTIKVQLFWEGHRNFRNCPHGYLWRLTSKFQNHKDDCAHFCGLPGKAELYKIKRNFRYLIEQNLDIENW